MTKDGTRDGRRAPSFLRDIVARPGEPHRRPAPPRPLDQPWVRKARVEGGPHDPALLERLQAATPSKIGIGRTGVRHRTATYLDMRDDHAIAKDAVAAEFSRDMAERLGCLEVTSRSDDREHYLLYPNEGRCLSDESQSLLSSQGDRGRDVQVILADGLAAPAAELNGPTLLPALHAALDARRISWGRPILARFARVGLQDDIGVLLGCRATVICLGERPGLGTGDSLSIYIAVSPSIDQDNAEKNCISNVRPLGLSPEAAAEMAADLMARGLELGRGGLELA